MKSKIYILCLLLIIPIFFLFNFGVISFSQDSQSTSTSIGTGITKESSVCVNVIKANSDGSICTQNCEIINVECGHNLLLNSGANMTRDLLFGGLSGAVTNITLCNATATTYQACATPTAAGTENFTKMNDCGLIAATGTYVVLSTLANASINKVFTSTCDGQITNTTRLGNATTYFAASSFSSTTLNTNDQLNLTWYNWVT